MAGYKPAPRHGPSWTLDASNWRAMKQDDAIAAAREYATNWSVPWGTITKIERRRKWWPAFAVLEFTFFFETEGGTGEAEVAQPNCTVVRFEYIPTGSEHWMIPLWAAYPGYDSITGAWRQGDCETYKYRWLEWYLELSDEKRSEYKTRFPPPQDRFLRWHGFYDWISDAPPEPGSRPEYRKWGA